jgi:hypothetical protein
MTANSLIYATQKKQLIMNDLQHIFYDFVGNVVFDTYGKTYQVKESKGWKFVNVGKSKISVSKLQKKFLIRNFDDFYKWKHFRSDMIDMVKRHKNERIFK